MWIHVCCICIKISIRVYILEYNYCSLFSIYRFLNIFLVSIFPIHAHTSLLWRYLSLKRLNNKDSFLLQFFSTSPKQFSSLTTDFTVRFICHRSSRSSRSSYVRCIMFISGSSGWFESENGIYVSPVSKQI